MQETLVSVIEGGLRAAATTAGQPAGKDNENTKS
jgi:hypothetical protein